VAAIDDLAAAQAQLGRALGRARAGEDRDLGRRVRERGEQLVRLVAGLLRLSRVHAPDNRAFDEPVQETAQVLAELTELIGPVHLAAVEDEVYLNDIRVRLDSRSTGRSTGTRSGGSSRRSPPSLRRSVRAPPWLRPCAPRASQPWRRRASSTTGRRGIPSGRGAPTRRRRGCTSSPPPPSTTSPRAES